ncbi:HotDog domain-containing protein [Haematococcus lacustris]
MLPLLASRATGTSSGLTSRLSPLFFPCALELSLPVLQHSSIATHDRLNQPLNSGHCASAQATASTSSPPWQHPPTPSLLRHWSSKNNLGSKEAWASWHALVNQLDEERINPCNSKLHPAVVEGVLQAPQGEELCVQEAYTSQSTCFGCGPSHPEGLKLRSRRVVGGLEGTVTLADKYCAFPGIISGGIVTAVLDCHANWTAAIALMDKACLPKPPLTLTASMNITYKEPTPPGVELLVRSKVLAIKESNQPGMGKASVEVEVSLYEPMLPDTPMKLLVQATGVFKRLGALRAM